MGSEAPPIVSGYVVQQEWDAGAHRRWLVQPGRRIACTVLLGAVWLWGGVWAEGRAWMLHLRPVRHIGTETFYATQTHKTSQIVHPCQDIREPSQPGVHSLPNGWHQLGTKPISHNINVWKTSLRLPYSCRRNTCIVWDTSHDSQLPRGLYHASLSKHSGCTLPCQTKNHFETP